VCDRNKEREKENKRGVYLKEKECVDKRDWE
jgi:hypothetical protein